MSKKITLLLIIAFGLLGSIASQGQVRIFKQVIGSGGAVGLKNTGNSKSEMSGVAGQVAIFNTKHTVGSTEVTAYQGFWVPDSLYAWNFVGVEEDVVKYTASNYPNPFVTSTTISYELPAPSRVTVKIYDLTGNMVRLLFDDYQNSGIQKVQWNAKDEIGMDVTSGSYVYEVTAMPAGGSYFEGFKVKKMMILAR